MNLLIIGGGGREHALAWKAAKSPKVAKVFVAPGNGGTAREEKCCNVDLDILDFPALIDFAKANQISLTLVGPEAPLAAGISDAFHNAGLHCFGPSKACAMLETSKQYAKEFMAALNIPTASYATFTELTKAIYYIEHMPVPMVIKADGLAAGKGVVIAASQKEASAAATAMLSGNQFGNAGNRIIIETFLPGEEASFMVISDGKTALPLATSQDHKALNQGDKGPNTGGMGAYSPAPVLTEALQKKVLTTIINPTLKAMAAQGTPYVGFLYAGLMIGTDGAINVLEFNCRLGDPETEVILLRLQTDLVDLCEHALNQQLEGYALNWDPRPALGVVLTASGYPGSYPKGDAICGMNHADEDGGKTFHAGTTLSGDQVLTNGGRVLCVCALGDSLAQAQRKAYQNLQGIHWPGMYYRSDIGHRTLTSTTE